MTSLTMTRVIGTTIDNIREKKHGIFVGISLGSKFFTEHNIREYILWACEHSLRSVVVLIADKPHAVNYELRNGYNPKRALAVVLRKGDELAKTIGSVMESLPEASRRRVNVLRWQNVEILDGYSEEREVFHRGFRDNTAFHRDIVRLVAENVGSEIHRFGQDGLDRLASYVLDELPLLLHGIEHKGEFFGLHPYHRLSRLHDLILRFQNGLAHSDVYKHASERRSSFVELTHKPEEGM